MIKEPKALESQLCTVGRVPLLRGQGPNLGCSRVKAVQYAIHTSYPTESLKGPLLSHTMKNSSVTSKIEMNLPNSKFAQSSRLSDLQLGAQWRVQITFSVDGKLRGLWKFLILSFRLPYQKLQTISKGYEADRQQFSGWLPLGVSWVPAKDSEFVSSTWPGPGASQSSLVILMGTKFGQQLCKENVLQGDSGLGWQPPTHVHGQEPGLHSLQDRLSGVVTHRAHLHLPIRTDCKLKMAV